MSSRSTTNPRWMSWTGLVYYGETVGFVVAWISGIAAIAYSSSAPAPAQPAVEQVAAAGVDR